MKNIGDTLKEIRLSKNYSLDKASKGVMSYSYLQRVESGQYSPSFEKVIKLLDRYNVSVNEFFFLKNEGEMSQKEEISNDIFNAFYLLKNRNEQLKKIENKAWNLYSESQDIYFQHIALFAKNAMHEYDKTFMEDDISSITQYFFSLENYTNYDFKLFTNFLSFFDIDTIFALVDKMLKSYKKYEKLGDFLNEYPFLLLNIISLAIENNLLEQAYKFMEQCREFLEKNPNAYAKMTYNYDKGVLLMKQGKVKEGKALVLRQIQYLEELEMYGHAKRFKEDFKKYSQLG